MKKNTKALLTLLSCAAILFHPSLVHGNKKPAVVAPQPINLEAELMVINGGNVDYIMDNIARLKIIAKYQFQRDAWWDVSLIKKLRHKINSLLDTAHIAKEKIENFKAEANMKHVLSSAILEDVKSSLAKLRERAHNVRKANMWINTKIRDNKNVYADRIKRTVDSLISSVNNIAKLIPVEPAEINAADISITQPKESTNSQDTTPIIEPMIHSNTESSIEPTYPEQLPAFETTENIESEITPEQE